MRHIISTVGNFDEAKILDVSAPLYIRVAIDCAGLIFDGVGESLIRKEEKSAKSSHKQSPLFVWGKNDRLPLGELLRK